MIIIYNISGLLYCLLSVFVGFCALLLTFNPGIGILTFGLMMYVTGKRRMDPATNTFKPYPSLFFIPNRFSGIAIGVFGIMIFIAGLFITPNPKQALLDADEKIMDASAISGNAELSQHLSTMLQVFTVKEAKMGDAKIFTKLNDTSVLVLVKMPTLKKFSDKAREDFVGMIEKVLENNESTKNKSHYIGIKGSLFYGAIKTPKVKKFGSTVLEEPLLEFYSLPSSQTGKTTPAASQSADKQPPQPATDGTKTDPENKPASPTPLAPEVTPPPPSATSPVSVPPASPDTAKTPTATSPSSELSPVDAPKTPEKEPAPSAPAPAPIDK